METRTYILPNTDTEMRLTRYESSIALHHNGGTSTFSLESARALASALMALLSTNFDFAVSEQTLLWESARAARYEGREATAHPSPRPTLEQL